jgi:hypothetical protein
MANPPPPYDNITGISRAVMKDNAQETLVNYDGNARPGEMTVNLTNNNVYIGNTNGDLTLIARGTGLSAYINYFDFSNDLTTGPFADPIGGPNWIKLNANTTSPYSSGTLTATNNRVTNTGTVSMIIKMEGIISVAPTLDYSEIGAAFFQNETLIPCSAQTVLCGLIGETSALPFHCVTQLDPDDYVEVWVQNISNETSITLDNVNVIITQL